MVKVASAKTDLRRGLDYIGVSACFVIHDGKGRILLSKRGPKARDERGHWDTGAGAIEFGEPIIEAVKREIREELGVEAIDIKFLKAIDVLREFDGHPSHWIAMIHAVKVDPKKVTIGEPHKIAKIDWFTRDNLPTPLHSQFWRVYEAAVSGGVVK